MGRTIDRLSDCGKEVAVAMAVDVMLVGKKAVFIGSDSSRHGSGTAIACL